MTTYEPVHLSMFAYENRLETFAGWPYTEKEGDTCTAEKLAHSGFFRPHPESEPELARCFMCCKDLEGWEPDDNPDVEHKSHCPSCPFVQTKVKDWSKMKVYDYIKLHYQHYLMAHRKVAEMRISDLKKKHETFKEEISKSHPF